MAASRKFGIRDTAMLRRTKAQSTRSLVGIRGLEHLEDRTVPQATLYVDFGDRLPAGGLTDTLGNLISAKSGSNPQVNGPDMIGFFGSNAGSLFNWQPYSSVYGTQSAANRAFMMDYVRRIYEPFDMAVVELTSNFQTVNGFSVRSASSLADISETLGANNSASKNIDTYVMVGNWRVVGNDLTQFLAGIASGTDLLGLGGTFNKTEASALVCVSAATKQSPQIQDNNFNGDTIAHEAGHNWGLGHVFPNYDGPLPAGPYAMGQGETMAYDRVAQTNSVDSATQFIRYPTMRGNGVGNPNILAPDAATTSNAKSNAEQMLLDPSIGPNPTLEYVTGTGAFDRITVTKTGANSAQVSVEAFLDANFTQPITVPNLGGTAYKYNITLSKPILIDGGPRDDQYILDPALGVTIRVRGTAGSDRLQITGTGNEAVTFTPSTFKGKGFSDLDDTRATLVVGSTTFQISEFLSTSTVTLLNVGNVAYNTPGGDDTITAAGIAGSKISIGGTVGGVAMFSLVIPNTKALAINLSAGDVAANKNTLNLNFATASPIPANGMTFTGGAGTDTIAVNANADFTLSDTLLNMGALGNVTLSSVDSANLTGGVANNTFTLLNWTGSATFNGATGKDTIAITQDAATITLIDSKLTTSNGTSVTLASFENAILTGGAADNIFDLNAWNGTATTDGQGGTDTIRLTRNADFTLTDALITLSDGSTYPLTSVERAELTGGAADTIFDLNAWTGGGAFDGKGGTNEFRITRNADMTLSGSTFTISAGLPIGLTNVQNAVLTGGASDNLFILDAWAGNAALDGLDGKDTYQITAAGGASAITISDSGAAGTPDIVNIIGGPVGQTYNILPDSVTVDGQIIGYTGVEEVNVTGGPGDDTFITDINKGVFAGGTFSLNGGGGQNTFAIIGTPAVTIQQSGVLFGAGNDGKIVLDPDGSITPSLTGTYNGDELIIAYKGMSKIGDVTPAVRFDFAFTSADESITVSDGQTFDGAATVLAYDGTRGVSVARKGQVVINGNGGTDSFTVDTTTAIPGVNAYDLVGGIKGESFSVKAANLPLNLIGAGGDDAFNLGSTNGLDAVTSVVTIDGGLGTNSVALNDSSSTKGNAAVSITPTSITGLTGTGTKAVNLVAGTVGTLSVQTSLGFASTVDVATLNIPFTLLGGNAGDTVTLAAIGATASVSTGNGADLIRLNGLSPNLALLTNGGNDHVTFNDPSGAPAGSLTPFTAAFTFDAGTGTDKVTFNDAAGAAGFAYKLTNGGLGRTGGVQLNYVNVEQAVLFGGGTGNNSYDVTGLTSGVSITDGGGDGSFSIAGATLGGTNTFNGGAGNDQFAFTGEGLAAPATVTGGTGTNKASLRSTAGNDSLVMTYSTATGGTVTGLGGGGGGVFTFTALTDLAADALGGSDNLQIVNATGAAATVAFVPTAAAAGNFTGTGMTAVNFTSVDNTFNYKGAAATDSLTVYGVSTTGLGSGVEATSANGVDTITITDTGVSITNTILGPMRSVSVDVAGVPTVDRLIIRAGNESGTVGDQVTVTPSTRVDLLIYGGGPTIKPGDKLVVNTVGPRTVSLDTDPNGKPITRVTQQSDGATVGFAEFETAPKIKFTIIGTGPNVENRVQVYDASSGALKFDFVPFENGFSGGLSVASDDLNGDNFPDLIVAAGKGGGPVVKVFNGLDGSSMGSFFAYDPSFTGGVQVAAGDVNNDGFADIVIGSGIGGGPHVQAVSGADLNTRLLNFFAYDPSFRDGVQVAAGDVDGDAIPDVVTGAGVGGGPNVRAFRGLDGTQLSNFFAMDPSFRGGVNVAISDVTGDGKADIIAAAAAAGSTQVYLFTPDGTLQSSFNAIDPLRPGVVLPIAREDGVRLAVADVDGDGIDDVITARGRGTQPIVRAIKVGSSTGPVTPAEVRAQLAFDLTYGIGVFVG